MILAKQIHGIKYKKNDKNSNFEQKQLNTQCQIRLINQQPLIILEKSQRSAEMSLPTPEVSLQAVRLTTKHINSAKECLAAGFLQKNEVWGAFNIKRQDLQAFFDGVIIDHLEFQARRGETCLNMVTLDKGTVTSCKLFYDLEDYIQKQKNGKPQDFELFRQLQKTGKLLTKDIDFDRYPRGKTAFGTFGVINPALKISNLMKVIYVTHLHKFLKKSGYQWTVGRFSNPRALGIYKKLGAKQLNEVIFQREGKKFKLIFYEMNLYSEAFLKMQANLDRLIQMQKHQIKQSKL